MLLLVPPEVNTTPQKEIFHFITKYLQNIHEHFLLHENHFTPCKSFHFVRKSSLHEKHFTEKYFTPQLCLNLFVIESKIKTHARFVVFRIQREGSIIISNSFLISLVSTYGQSLVNVSSMEISETNHTCWNDIVMITSLRHENSLFDTSMSAILPSCLILTVFSGI